MAHLQTHRLFDSPIVRVVHAACRAPRSAPAEVEWSAVAQIVLPRRGVFAVHRGRERVVADTSTALVLGCGEEYRVDHPADGGDDCVALVFAPELAEEALGGLGGRHGHVRGSTQLHAQLLTSALAGGARDRLEVEDAALLLLDAFAHDLRTRRPFGDGDARRRIDRARELLASDPAAPWSLGALGRALHVSPYHLARQFRAVTGESVSRYLVGLRLGVALERLVAGETHLARLAVEAGFAHHSHFSARFRKAFGVTPTQLRARLAAGALRA